MPQQYGLGRGLSSLIPQKGQTTSAPRRPVDLDRPKKSISSEEREDNLSVPHFQKLKKDQGEERQQSQGDAETMLEVEITKISANSHQPRLAFDETKLQELAESIREHGIIQPLVVTRASDSTYELIAGERRLRAAKLAGLQKVPVVIRESHQQEKFELAILENVQRHDLSPLEEARAYRRLMDEFHLSQEDVALRIGKSRSGIANSVRLLDLPTEIQRGLEEGKITPGHAKIILSIENSEKQRALYELILREGLTVRQTEDRVRSVATGVRTQTRITSQDPQLKASQDELAEKLGTKVQVKRLGQGAKVSIDFYSKQDLVQFLNKL